MLVTACCRLGYYPEITEMQTRAIIEAACNLKLKGLNPKTGNHGSACRHCCERIKHQQTSPVARQMSYLQRKVKVDYMVEP